MNTSYKNINSFQFKIIYHGTVTSLLQQNTFFLRKKKQKYYDSKNNKVMWVQNGCRPVGDQLRTDRRSIGDRLEIGWRLFLQRMFMITERSMTVWRPVGNRSAISRRLKTVMGLQPLRQPIADQSLTYLRPPKPFYDQFGRREVSLAASKTSLRPNRPCHIPATSPTCRDQSATSLQPPCDRPK